MVKCVNFKKIFSVLLIMNIFYSSVSFSNATEQFNINDFPNQEVYELGTDKNFHYYECEERLINSRGAYNGKEYVVYQSNATYITSPNGVSWSKAQDTDYVIDDIKFIDNYFYALAKYNSKDEEKKYLNVLLVSNDLKEWQVLKELKSFDQYRLKIINQDLFCLGRSNNPIYIFKKGHLIKKVQPIVHSDYGLYLYTLGFDGSNYVFINDSTYYKSADLINWASHKSNTLSKYSTRDSISKDGVILFHGSYADNNGATLTGIYSMINEEQLTFRIVINKNNPKKISHAFETEEGLFILLNGKYYHSNDLKNWHESAVKGTWSIFSYGKFLSADSDNIYFQNQSGDWVSRENNTNNYMNYTIQDIANSESTLAYIGKYRYKDSHGEFHRICKVMATSDGENFKEVALPTQANSLLSSINYDMNKWFVYSIEGTENFIYMSSNLKEWTKHPISVRNRKKGQYQFDKIFSYNNQLYGIGRNFNDGEVYTSTNGYEWTVMHTFDALISDAWASEKGIIIVDGNNTLYRTKNFETIEMFLSPIKMASYVMSFEADKNLYLVMDDYELDAFVLYKNNQDHFVKVATINEDNNIKDSVLISNAVAHYQDPLKLGKSILFDQQGQWQYTSINTDYMNFSESFKSIFFKNKLYILGYKDKYKGYKDVSGLIIKISDKNY